MSCGVTLKFERDGKSGLGTLSAYAGNEVLAAERLNIFTPKKRGAFVERLIEGRDGLDRKAIEDALLRLAGEEAQRENGKNTSQQPDPLDAMPEGVKTEALAMLRDPELIRLVVDDLETAGVTGERKLATTIYLVGTSRLLARPLAAIVQGPTSSGKSYVNARVASLFPSEAVIRAHKMTPEAMAHMSNGSLMHRFVVAGERSHRRDDAAADATRALREMLADGRLTKLMPVKQRGGEIQTVQLDQPGPIAYVESTTLNDIDDEDRNRCLLLSTDEQPEQTRRIVCAMAQRKLSESAGEINNDVALRHHAAQRMLKRCNVVIPFANQLAERYPCERTDARRSFGQLLSMIEAVALLHQFQRVGVPEDEVVIEATLDDYGVARYLLAEPLARTMGRKCPDAALRFFCRLKSRVAGEFSSVDAMRGETIVANLQTVRGYLRALLDSGYIEVVQQTRGNIPATYRLVSKPPDLCADDCGMPDPQELLEANEVKLAAQQRVAR